MNVRMLNTAKNQKAPASVIPVTRVVKNLVTRKASVQLKVVETEDANDLTSGENSSDIINQGIGPNPIEKARTKTDSETTGKIEIL